MSKHHHHHKSQPSGKGIGDFLSNINISQLASLVSALNLKSIDTSQLTSLISKLGIGGLNGSKLSQTLSSNNAASNSPVTLNNLGNLGLLNKEELSAALARFTEKAQGENIEDTTQTTPDAQGEAVNEVLGALKSILGNMDTNEILNLVSKLSPNNDK